MRLWGEGDAGGAREGEGLERGTRERGKGWKGELGRGGRAGKEVLGRGGGVIPYAREVTPPYHLESRWPL